MTANTFRTRAWFMYVRAIVYAFSATLSLACAALYAFLLLRGWTFYASAQRCVLVIFLIVYIVSAVVLYLMIIVPFRLRLDGVCAVTLLLFHIGGTTTSAIILPSLPFKHSASQASCKTAENVVIFGDCIITVILTLYSAYLVFMCYVKPSSRPKKMYTSRWLDFGKERTLKVPQTQRSPSPVDCSTSDNIFTPPCPSPSRTPSPSPDDRGSLSKQPLSNQSQGPQSTSKSIPTQPAASLENPRCLRGSILSQGTPTSVARNSVTRGARPQTKRQGPPRPPDDPNKTEHKEGSSQTPSSPHDGRVFVRSDVPSDNGYISPGISPRIRPLQPLRLQQPCFLNSPSKAHSTPPLLGVHIPLNRSNTLASVPRSPSPVAMSFTSANAPLSAVLTPHPDLPRDTHRYGDELKRC